MTSKHFSSWFGHRVQKVSHHRPGLFKFMCITWICAFDNACLSINFIWICISLVSNIKVNRPLDMVLLRGNNFFFFFFLLLLLLLLLLSLSSSSYSMIAGFKFQHGHRTSMFLVAFLSPPNKCRNCRPTWNLNMIASFLAVPTRSLLIILSFDDIIWGTAFLHTQHSYI